MHFLIVSPCYTAKSNGIAFLFKLGDILVELGHDVQFYLTDTEPHQPPAMPPNFQGRIVSDVRRLAGSTICILPDALPDGIAARFQKHQKIWFWGNKPMFITGLPINLEPQDLVVAYSKIVSRHYFNMFVNMPLEGADALFAGAAGTKANSIALYFGKSMPASSINTAFVSNIVREKKYELNVITRSDPREKSALYGIIQKARLLITFDPITNLIYESLLCGTPVYVAQNPDNIDYGDCNLELQGVFQTPDLFGEFYEKGIPPGDLERMRADYFQSVSAHTQTVSNFVHKARDWFSFCSGRLNPGNVTAFVAEKRSVEEALQVRPSRSLTEEVAGILSGSIDYQQELEMHNRRRLQLVREDFDRIGGVPIYGMSYPKMTFYQRKRMQWTRFLKKHLERVDPATLSEIIRSLNHRFESENLLRHLHAAAATPPLFR